MRRAFGIVTLMWVGLMGACAASRGDANTSAGGWRPLPLVKGGKVHPSWRQVGYGEMVVDNGALRTQCDERGLGLLVYTKQKLGDCQIRVVYRAERPNSNAGVFVRVDDGILQRLDEMAPPAKRDAAGRLPPESLRAMQEGSEKELGPWYAVHHGYEVQIADAGDEFHRTGAIYSYARADAAPAMARDQWRTMVITLQGNQVLVDLDGKRVTTFDSASTDVPPRKQWHEPRREHQRPQKGYIGLQTHDPGDVVWFKEVSVRPLT